MKPKLKAAELSARLAGNILGLCGYLLPNGKQHGAMWSVGGVNGDAGKSLQVNLSGPHAGNWRDWNGQEQKGDALDLWGAVRCVPLPEAIRQAKEWLGIREEPPEKVFSKPKDDRPTLSADGMAMHWLATERKLAPEIVNRYRVQGDAASKAIVFPSYSPAGALLNRSFRCVALDEKGKKKVWQDKDAAPALFGWQSIREEAYRAREILICEGQIDAMTWAQWGVPALSIPNGSGQTWIDFEWDNLEPFKTIWLSFDNDGKTAAALTAAISRLGKHRCRVVKFLHKDANDALRAGASTEDARRWMDAAEYPTVAHLFEAGHYADLVAAEFFPSRERLGHPIPHTTHASDRGQDFNFRPAEVSVWTGVSSHGKSTILNYAMMHLAICTGRPSLIISLEMPPAKVIFRCIRASGANPPTEIAAKETTRLFSKLLLLSDKTGGITKADLFEMLEYAHARYGICHAAIDSLMRIHAMEEDYPAQNELIIALCGYAKDTGVHVHLVAHPRKQNGHDSPQAHDIKGSGHIRDNADNVLVVWRNRKMEITEEAGESVKDMVPAKLIIEKDREGGAYREFNMKFERQFLCYSPWKK